MTVLLRCIDASATNLRECLTLLFGKGRCRDGACPSLPSWRERRRAASLQETGTQPLNLRRTTIDKEFNSGDKAAVVGSQEYRRFGDFIRSAQPPHRNGGNHGRLELLGFFCILAQGIDSGRIDWAGADGVDPDLAVFQIGGPRTRKRTHSSLGCAVNAKCRHALHGNDGSVQDDGPSVDQQRKRLLYGEEKSFDIRAERLVEMRLGDGSQRSEFTAAGIGEDNINAACFLLDRRIQPVEVRKVRYVALNSGDVLADQLDGLIEFALTATGDEDLGTLCDKALRGGEADAAVASGYDCYFPFELPHIVLLLCDCV